MMGPPARLPRAYAAWLLTIAPKGLIFDTLAAMTNPRPICVDISPASRQDWGSRSMLPEKSNGDSFLVP